MAKVTELKTREDADAMLAASHEAPVALLKHSIACPISARGQEQFVGLEGDEDPEMYAVVVQYARDVSNYLAEALGVKHETPQAVIVKAGEAASVFNHHRIKTGDLREAARAAAA
ncbi:MAG: bacillithiol system redox-active protein YtxJ [Bacteroidota bacterium]